MAYTNLLLLTFLNHSLKDRLRISVGQSKSLPHSSTFTSKPVYLITHSNVLSMSKVQVTVEVLGYNAYVTMYAANQICAYSSLEPIIQWTSEIEAIADKVQQQWLIGADSIIQHWLEE